MTSFLPLIPLPKHLEELPGRNLLPGEILARSPFPDDLQRIVAPELGRHSIGSRLVDQASGSDLTARIEPGAPSEAEGYRLTIDQHTINAEAPTRAGLRHALRTLSQVIRSCGHELPCLRIEDAPSFPVRGVMLDISRDKVPTMETLRAVIDDLAALKINHLQLYTEHAFAYAGHETVWEHASPITPDEARALDAYCAERGIALAPNQNTLGHMERWLRHPRYADLAETHGEFTFHTEWGRSISRTGPFSLCSTDPASIALIEDLLSQLLPCFRASVCNIGCDEAHDIGSGRSKNAVESRGQLAVYLDHLTAVNRIVDRLGRRSLFWADMIIRHPTNDWRDQMPDGAIPLIWGYEADTPFDRWCDSMCAAGIEHWVCPGTSSWRSIVGRSSVRRANIAAAARAGLASGATGFLITDWGDLGHRQHAPISMHSIAHGAHAAWNAEQAGAFDPAAASLNLFGTPDLGPILDELGDADAALRDSLGLRNTNALFSELHRSIAADPNPLGPLDEWEEIRQRLAGLRDRFESVRPTLADPTAADEVEHTLRVAEHAADKGVITRASARAGRSDLPGPARIRLAADMASILEDHRELWPRRNRPGGLDDSARYYECLIEDDEGTPRRDI